VLTEEEKKRVGVALKKLRLNHGWDQYDIAEKADLGVGTVQRIEIRQTQRWSRQPR
jgi:transcriptional regulator with XRE-family HTH domain